MSADLYLYENTGSKLKEVQILMPKKEKFVNLLPKTVLQVREV